MKIEKDGRMGAECGGVSAEDLEQVNQLTRRKFAPEELFVFRVVLCDNEIDRDWERFSEEALQRLSVLFLGKTGICDHSPKAANQQARIFQTRVVQKPGRVNALGQPYQALEAKAYMVRTESNRDLILEIEGGIKKEISVGCSMGGAVCSICGLDRNKQPCEHQPGRDYGGECCHVILTEPADAYEWSFVAVPAQRNAGVVKGFQMDFEMESAEELCAGFKKGKAVSLSGRQAEALGRKIQRLEEDCVEFRRQVRKEVAGAAAKIGIPDSVTAELFFQALDRLSIQEMKALGRVLERGEEKRRNRLAEVQSAPKEQEVWKSDNQFVI